MEVGDGDEANLDGEAGSDMDDRTLSLFVTVFLLLMLLPALAMHRSLMTQQSTAEHETKTAEE
jgi:hypothetical protein